MSPCAVAYPPLIFCKQEGEPVEFTTQSDDVGRVRAERVTGPMGAYVQGAPRPQSFSRPDHYGNDDAIGDFLNDDFDEPADNSGYPFDDENKDGFK